MARPSGGYLNEAGKKIPGTTTIIGRFKESGGLLHWAYKQGREHEAALRLGDPNAPSHLYDARDKAAEAGTLAHDMIEATILGNPYTLPDNTPLALACLAQQGHDNFVQWRDNWGGEIIDTESTFISERHQFAGTLDGVGREKDGTIVLLDWKTSNNIYADYLYQLAAYALLLEENKPEWTPKGFHILRVAKETADFAHHYYRDLEDAKRGFVLMRELYDIADRLKKRA